MLCFLQCSHWESVYRSVFDSFWKSVAGGADAPGFGRFAIPPQITESWNRTPEFRFNGSQRGASANKRRIETKAVTSSAFSTSPQDAFEVQGTGIVSLLVQTLETGMNWQKEKPLNTSSLSVRVEAANLFGWFSHCSLLKKQSQSWSWATILMF